MKKFLFALAIGASLFASCQRTETDSKPTLFKFSYAMRGTSMYSTKAVSSTDVLDAINATLPQTIAIVLQSQTGGKTYTTRTGEGVVLPTDTYKVTGSVEGDAVTTPLVNGTSTYLATSPKVLINETISVEDDVTDYTLSGTYGSFALVVDSEEVEAAFVTTTKGEVEIPFIHSGTSEIIFGQGDYSSTYLSIRVVPTDKERYKETTFTLSTKTHTNVGLVEFGRFYVLHPSVDGLQPKCVGFDLPSFVEGQLNL